MKNYNTPRISAIRPVSASYADNLPMLRISYSRAPRPGEAMTSQYAGATVAVDANGGTSSQLLITLTENRISETGAASTVVNTINGATYTTLKEVVKAINAVAGFTAWVTDAPFAHSTASDAFLDLSATAIPDSPGYLDFLKRSVATSNPVYKRIGEPTERDNGYMKWIRAEVAITSETAGQVEVGKDDGIEAYSAYFAAPLTATANTPYLSYNRDEAFDVKGALLVTVSATSLAGCVLRAATQSANY